MLGEFGQVFKNEEVLLIGFAEFDGVGRQTAEHDIEVHAGLAGQDEFTAGLSPTESFVPKPLGQLIPRRVHFQHRSKQGLAGGGEAFLEQAIGIALGNAFGANALRQLAVNYLENARFVRVGGDHDRAGGAHIKNAARSPGILLGKLLEQLGDRQGVALMVQVAIMHDHIEPAKITVGGKEGCFFETVRIIFHGSPDFLAIALHVFPVILDIVKGIGLQFHVFGSAFEGLNAAKEIADGFGSEQEEINLGEIETCIFPLDDPCNEGEEFFLDADAFVLEQSIALDIGDVFQLINDDQKLFDAELLENFEGLVGRFGGVSIFESLGQLGFERLEALGIEHLDKAVENSGLIAAAGVAGAGARRVHKKLQSLAGTGGDPTFDGELILERLIIGNLVIADEKGENALFETWVEKPLTAALDDPVGIGIDGMTANLVADPAFAKPPTADEQEEPGKLVRIIEDIPLVFKQFLKDVLLTDDRQHGLGVKDRNALRHPRVTHCENRLSDGRVFRNGKLD